jgi:hypothetical protein
MTGLLIGTADGLHELGNGREPRFAGREVNALTRGASGWWAIVDGGEIWRSGDGDEWQRVAGTGGVRANCLLPMEGGTLVGAAEARMLRVEDLSLAPIRSFDAVAGRDDWYTPWGGPPDARSISGDASGAVYVNVHVGGIPRSRDGGASWEPTIDIHADVHQVLAGSRAGLVLAACARGLAVSQDAGDSWKILNDGLHANYCRAVAVAGESILVSASTGPSGRRAAVYRTSLANPDRLEQCRDGLPEWFAENVDTYCLAAEGSTAALGTADGSVFVSDDEGRTWREAAAGLPSVRCVALR